MLVYQDKTINGYLEKVFKENRKKIAIFDGTNNVSYSYFQLENYIEMMARGLMAYGVEKGDHIGILAPNCPEWVVILLAANKIGATVVCLNTGINNEQLQYAINYSEISMLFTTTTLLGQLEDAYECISYDGLTDLNSTVYPKLKKIFTIDVDRIRFNQAKLDLILRKGTTVLPEALEERESLVKPEDISTIQFTSGTKGNPKAVCTKQVSILNNALTNAYNIGYTNEDKVLLGTPLFHILGYIGTALTILTAGGTLVLLEKFQTKRVLEVIEQEQCTSFHGVPTVYQYMLNKYHSYNLSSLKKGMIAGAYCREEVAGEILSKLKMEKLANIYGQTEVISIGEIDYMPENIGKEKGFRILQGVNVKIVDGKTHQELPAGTVGEVAVNSHFVMLGYYKNEAATAKTLIDGWVYTGDLARIDESGQIFLQGRMSDVIIRGGENISSVEIEKCLGRIEKIQEIAIVGVPDALLGEEIAAFITLKEGEVLEADEVYAYAHKYLAKQEYPKHIFIKESLPYTASGKVKKYELVEWFKKENKND